uniref:Uncharacterized protein n=1 Tax=Myoviridae sp. ct3wi9 TaxID=2826610 RepID=A0A8S5MWJ5_9CAUD|nr:MAG TPA: hypothetical protein [Myoviridae sp. ct3wi9]
MCKSNKNKRSLIVSGLLFLFEKKKDTKIKGHHPGNLYVG